ncbi:MAG: hypothetical protein QOE28_1770, partial [Solirubrobacteraceae bacterium]|nr:hypothetical protein [Solirubrobacteraceae bacterium]
MADPVEDAAAELYGLPLDGFVAARDARAKALRKDGDRESAAAVAKLQKPSRVAAEVNRLARDGHLDALLKAGAKLRAAQLEGGGSVREAAAAEREAVAAVIRGLELSADQTERVRT